LLTKPRRGGPRLVLPVLPSFYELEAARRKDKAAAARADASAHRRAPPALGLPAAALARHAFEGTQPAPKPPLELGAVGPAFYGSVQRRNPRRLPSTAVGFWQAHAASAPVPTALGLSVLSFALPDCDEFATDAALAGALTSGVVSAATDARTRSVMDPRAAAAAANPPVALLPDDIADHAVAAEAAAVARGAAASAAASFAASAASASAEAEAAAAEAAWLGARQNAAAAAAAAAAAGVGRRALRAVSLHGGAELWGDEGRSLLARPMAPSLVAALLGDEPAAAAAAAAAAANPFLASSAAGAGQVESARLDRALLVAASVSASAGAGPDWAHVMLAAPAFR
jgi:hypothetical protein